MTNSVGQLESLLATPPKF